MPDKRPPPSHLALKAINRLRRRGPGETLALLRSRLEEAVASQDRLVMFERHTGDRSREREAQHADDLILREAGPSDAGLYGRDIGTDSPLTFRTRLSVATRCYLVIGRGRALHATWVTTAGAWTRELHDYICPPEGDAYAYESFTRADARGMGVYPFALRSIAARLQREGIGRLWVAVEADNEPSLRAVDKAGFEVAFEISYRRRWGRVHVDAPVGRLAELADGFIGCRPT